MRSESSAWAHVGLTEPDDVESAAKAVMGLIQARFGDPEVVARLAFSTTEGTSHARIYHFDVIGGAPFVQRRVVATLSDGDVWEAVFAD